MNRYKATKLSVLEKPENGKTAEDLKKTNEEIFKNAGELGLISGFYAVEPGMSFTGLMSDLQKLAIAWFYLTQQMVYGLLRLLRL